MLAAILVLSGAAVIPASVGGQERSGDSGRIVDTERTGPGVIGTFDEELTYVWQSEPYAINVTFQVNASEDQYSVCLYKNTTDRGLNRIACQSTRIGNGSTASVNLSVGNASKTGNRSLYLELRPSFGQNVSTLDERTIDQKVVRKEDDEDGDGLSNEFEVEEAKSKDEPWPDDAFIDKDMDSDGLSDGDEVNKYKTNPLKTDTDGDGIPDTQEIRQGTDPLDPSNPGTTTNATEEGIMSNGLSRTTVFVLVVAFGAGILGAAALLWRIGGDDGLSDGLSVAGATHGADSTAEPAAAPPNAEEDDALTDEGQVIRLLRANRGRMKQVDIVEETGWSKSKVSRLLSRMEERGDVNRLRVGRGNIVYLDGATPGGVPSSNERD